MFADLSGIIRAVGRNAPAFGGMIHAGPAIIAGSAGLLAGCAGMFQDSGEGLRECAAAAAECFRMHHEHKGMFRRSCCNVFVAGDFVHDYNGIT